MSCDQLLNTLVIINIATSQGSSQHLCSDFWNYLDKVESKRVPCKVCKQNFAYHGSTTNLCNHLQRTHGTMYVPECTDSSGQKIESV